MKKIWANLSSFAQTAIVCTIVEVLPFLFCLVVTKSVSASLVFAAVLLGSIFLWLGPLILAHFAQFRGRPVFQKSIPLVVPMTSRRANRWIVQNHQTRKQQNLGKH